MWIGFDRSDQKRTRIHVHLLSLSLGRDQTSSNASLYDVERSGHRHPEGYQDSQTCSLICDVRFSVNGGAGRNRTDDILLAKQALSQLSYGPFQVTGRLVGPGGLEPPTSRLSGVRSNHLSYGPLDHARSPASSLANATNL
jgi:hypothetical protein